MNFHKLENETESQHLWRLGQSLNNGISELTWDDITDILNQDWHENDERTKKTFYNRYQQAKVFYDDGIFGKIETSDDMINDLTEQRHEIIKAKQQLFDERRDLNAKLRKSARYEEDVERICRIFQTIGKERYIVPKVENIGCNKTMIVCLSDLHIGSEWAGHTGYFSSATAKVRLDEYYNNIISIAQTNGANRCIVLGLGDYVNGNIHKTIQITNKENIVEQVKFACEYISDFVYSLSKYFSDVEFHSVSGNHSRLDKKDDAIIDERLDSLIPWFLKNMLMHIDNINIVTEEMDSTMLSFHIGDKIFVGVHGDYDGMNDATVSKLCMWLGYNPNCIIMGHKHHHAMTEVSGIKVVQSGSLCGTGDNFTREKRLKGKPSQTVILCKEDGSIEAVYPVELS